MISAIILAAGLSTRMGALKQLLPYGDRSVIEQVVSVLLNCPIDEIIVVTGHRHDEIHERLAKYPVRLALNARYREEMLTSIQCGWAESNPGTDAVMHVLGDQPQIEEAVVKILVAAQRESGGAILVPSFNHRRGHPILIDGKYRAEILGLAGLETMRDFMQAHAEQIHHITVETDSILRDMDTPADYQRELARHQGQYQISY